MQRANSNSIDPFNILPYMWWNKRQTEGHVPSSFVPRHKLDVVDETNLLVEFTPNAVYMGL